MLITIYHQIFLIIGYYLLFGGFELEYEVLYDYGVDAKFVEFISDEAFILYLCL